MRKIYVVGRASSYANWMEGELVKEMADADLVVFTGGEDVDPRTYTIPEKRNPTTHSTLERDMFETYEFNRAERMGKHMIGICRGAQLMCILNGGRLVQNQDNPGRHPIYTYDGKKFDVSSLHHQACYPFQMPKEDYQILGWTEDMLHYHEDGNELEMNPPVEVEVIQFPKTKCLGIQGHPEMMAKDSPAVIYFQNLLTQFLNNKIIKNEFEEAYNR